MSAISFVQVVSTDGVRVRRHVVPVIAHSRCVVARRHGSKSPTPGAVVPPLFSRGDQSPTLLLKIAAGMVGQSPTYIETRWVCGEADGKLVLPPEAMTKIATSLAAQEVTGADGSVSHPWRLATAEEAVSLVESVDTETRSALDSILAQHGMGRPAAAPSASSATGTATSADMEELRLLRAEKAERLAADEREALKATLKAEVIAAVRAELRAEQAAKTQREKLAAEAAELVELRARLAEMVKASTG